MQLKRFINKYFTLRSPKAVWRNWHGLLGVIVALPLILLTVTGLLLNHSEDLGLSRARVSSEWVMKQYGFELDQPVSAMSIAGGGFVVQAEEQLIYKGAVVASGDDELVGGAKIEGGLCLVTTKEVHYFDEEGKLVETLGSTTLPTGFIDRVGYGPEKRLILSMIEGGDEKLVRFDRDLFSSKETSIAEVTWSDQRELSNAEKSQVNEALIGEGLPLERVILDLHSGRFFGSIGKWLVSVFSVILLLVTFSGLVVFFRNKTRLNKNCLKDCSAPCGEF